MVLRNHCHSFSVVLDSEVSPRPARRGGAAKLRLADGRTALESTLDQAPTKPQIRIVTMTCWSGPSCLCRRPAGRQRACAARPRLRLAPANQRTCTYDIPNIPFRIYLNICGQNGANRTTPSSPAGRTGGTLHLNLTVPAAMRLGRLMLGR